ncbi:MAG: phosphoribosylformylglycinamidine synthase subunit PurQ [Pirellulales bacterium]|nr:phosphoribosylformylglycinamidine synthase subunit PurQ [Pirellulales bacterium]
MPIPHVLILRAPGTNCDRETAFAFEKAGATTETLHINRLLENPRLFERFQILCVPGGFSYGDDIASGRILGNQIQHHLNDQMMKFKDDGKLMLGICNGFQILMKSPVLLPPDREQGPLATLTANDSGKYEDRWVHLEIRGGKCVFLEGIERMYLPVAHAEGKFVARNEGVLRELDAAGQLALRYVSARTSPTAEIRTGMAGDVDIPARILPFPENPNGAQANVAGVCDSTGRVLGLMPHPERHLDPLQHPRWTRGEAGAVGDGFQIFVNAVRYFSN